MIFPSFSFMGAPLSSIGISLPSRRRRIVWFERVTMTPFPEHLRDRVRSLLPAVFVYDVEDFLDWPLQGLAHGPACQLLCHRIHVRDAGRRVSGNDRVSDAR